MRKPATKGGNRFAEQLRFVDTAQPPTTEPGWSAQDAGNHPVTPVSVPQQRSRRPAKPGPPVRVPGVAYPTQRQIRELFALSRTTPPPNVQPREPAATEPAEAATSDDHEPAPPADQPLPVPPGDTGGWLPAWGGRPVPMPQHVGHVRVDARAPVAVTAAATLTALPGFRVAELLATRGRSRRDQVEQIMAGLPIGQGRTVLIASLFGGVGVSTLATLLGQAWASRGRHVDLVDATGSWAPGLPERSVPSPTLRLRTEHADAGAGPQDSIQANLWVIDSGSDPARLRRQLIEEPPQLLVMVCRPNRTELQRTANFLRAAHQDGWLNCHRRAVVAAVGKIRRGVHADLSVIADIGSAIPLPHTRQLADRTRQVSPADITPHVETLAAAAAIAPNPTHPLTAQKKASA